MHRDDPTKDKQHHKQIASLCVIWRTKPRQMGTVIVELLMAIYRQTWFLKQHLLTCVPGQLRDRQASRMAKGIPCVEYPSMHVPKVSARHPGGSTSLL
jgi:hypothetical protein